MSNAAAVYRGISQNNNGRALWSKRLIPTCAIVIGVLAQCGVAIARTPHQTIKDRKNDVTVFPHRKTYIAEETPADDVKTVTYKNGKKSFTSSVKDFGLRTSLAKNSSVEYNFQLFSEATTGGYQSYSITIELTPTRSAAHDIKLKDGLYEHRLVERLFGQDQTKAEGYRHVSFTPDTLTKEWNLTVPHSELAKLDPKYRFNGNQNRYVQDGAQMVTYTDNWK